MSNESRFRILAELQAHDALIQIRRGSADVVPLVLKHRPGPLEQHRRLFEFAKLAVRNAHNGQRLCHLKGLCSGFESVICGLRKASRLAVHVHLQVDFALGKVAEWDVPWVRPKGAARVRQDVEGLCILALTIVEIAEVVVTDSGEPCLAGFLGELSR